MSKAKWLILFLLALVVAVPSYAVELTLGGFPSYMRTRATFIKGATFLSTMSDRNAQRLGFNDNDDNIMFVDTRLRLTPQLVLSDKVTIRAQVDVFDNNIWGGIGSGFVGNPGTNAAAGSTLVNSADTPNSRFRGALLTNQIAGDCARGTDGFVRPNGQLATTVCGFFNPNDATDDAQFFNVRMLHADIVLPYDLGFVRIGRQPFDWGLGILANGGWDPQSDLGFVLDRFLWLKSWGLGGDAGTFTVVFVTDRFTQGQSLETGLGDGWDGGAVALIYNNPNIMGTNLTVGGYVFPYIHQEGVLSIPPVGGQNAGQPFDIDLQRLTLWAGLIDFKTDLWRFVGEIQGAQGEVETNLGGVLPNFDITQHNLLFAVRAEVYPGWPIKLVAAEFGWAGGDNTNTKDVEGNAIVFSPAYNLDNLMYKHIIPNIYRIEGSVINSFYARAWGTVKIADPLSFTPQVVVGWNEETNSPLYPSGTFGQGVNTNVDRYLGTEVEGTLTWQVWPGVNFDVIGSLVFAGSGLKQLEKQQASAVMNSTSNNTLPNQFNAFRFPWAVQGRLLIYIDQFFK
ncbi:MAG TPA: hypothetical protein VGA95_02625 [Thermodesulfobacteriota bacterium]